MVQTRAASDQLEVTLAWRALDRMSTDYTAFVPARRRAADCRPE